MTTLITSASYVEAELAAEFGRLPPAFLPVGHKRLYDIQAQLLGPGVHVSLPESFIIPTADEQRMANTGLNVVRVPDGLSLAESILYAIDMIGTASGAVRLLHGDTIIYDLPEGEDVVSTGDAPDFYEWGAVSSEGPGGKPPAPVLSGYFHFADVITLRRALTMSRGDFLTALRLYGETRALTSSKVGTWLDFGHLQTYYRSRCSIRTQRAFNDMSISYQVVEKRSVDVLKMCAEATWYQSLPPPLRLYTPAFLGQTEEAGNVEAYRIEYLPIPSLHELFVFGLLGEGAWRQIVGSCFDFMRSCAANGTEERATGALRELTESKTPERLDAFFAARGIASGREWRYRGRSLPSLHRIAEIASKAIDFGSTDLCGIMHGDLCFTNIFYDFRTCRVRVIDPRGLVGTQIGTGGDVRYDMAKLYHSIHGAYDFILAERYRCTGFNEGDLAIDFPVDSSFDMANAVAREFDLAGYRLGDAENVAVTIHLFLSMLPLHADHPARQQALLANALRLFSESFVG
jgi:hypothetical protein